MNAADTPHGSSDEPAPPPGVRWHIDGHVAWATLDNPTRGNAIAPEMRDGLNAFWSEVRDNPDVRVSVVRGAGDRHFCTGIDVSRVASRGDTDTGTDTYASSVRLTGRNHQIWKPTICMVNGLVAGAGLEFVTDADIVIAGDHVAFTDPHVDIGQVGGLENIGLVYRMGLGGALLLTIMGKAHRMTAARAHQLGLVDVLVPQAELEATVTEMAKAITKVSPQAVSYSIQAVWQSLGRDRNTAMELGWALIRGMKLHPDFREGPRAFAEGRPPAWDVGGGHGPIETTEEP
jgi:E-phenylitaconyl-CoA hydratase